MPEPLETPTPDAHESAAETQRPRRALLEYLTDPSARRVEWLALGLLAALGLFVLLATRSDLVAQTVPAGPVAEDPVPATDAEDRLRSTYRFTDLDLHPDRVFGLYFSGAYFRDPLEQTVAAGAEGSSSAARAREDFRRQMEIYRRRAADDDNFTIRVYDNRTWQTLEVFTLHEERERFRQTGTANWDRIDGLRREASRTLVDRWVARGIPREHVATRWGRANQILEAREREEAYIEYEIRYARQLGLSLLTTEIGTVETFNQDWMVSPANARGRYQMMPDILRLFGLHTYTLPAGRGTVTVREELHPLLSLKGSFQLVRGYANAVGHEIPGISAYHTGPGNIFHLYQTFLRAKAHDPAVQEASVIDAYMWGVTTGFERVRQQSSFGPHSRAYVLSAYGALRAVENIPIDPQRTLRTERVQLRPGQSITLSALLELLAPHGTRLDWGFGNDADNLYERFRRLNKHIGLPAAEGPGPVAVPASGDVRFAATAGNVPVRFFLPHGATDLLERIRPGLIDASRTFRFDENAFQDPALTGEKTRWDYAYDELVQDIARFGFTMQNRARLEAIYRNFVRLAEEQPSFYREAQLKIITIHRRVWQTTRFVDLAGTVQNVFEGRRHPIRALRPAGPVDATAG